MSKYLEKSVVLMAGQEGASHQAEVVKAYLTLARYSDLQYQRIQRHMESMSFLNKKQLLDRSKEELELLSGRPSDTSVARSV